MAENYDRWRKSELLAEAERLGIDVPDDATKSDIIGALDNFNAGTYEANSELRVTGVDRDSSLAEANVGLYDPATKEDEEDARCTTCGNPLGEHEKDPTRYTHRATTRILEESV